MNYLEKVMIFDFWGTKNITIDFNPGINFLIGVNGSGKTTVINMIAATLNADFYTLDRLPFRKIEIQLKKVRGRSKPSIVVQKKLRKKSPYPAIKFLIKDKVSGVPTSYDLDELEEERVYRRMPPEYFHRHPSLLKKIGRGASSHINNLVNLSWLSIHRTTPPHRSHEERSFESSVDRKLDDLSNELLKYFSLLSKKSNDETEKFQKSIFLSLLADEGEDQLLSATKKLNIDTEKTSLIDIFQAFGLSESAYGRRVETHYKAFADSMSKLKNKKSIFINDLNSLLGSWRIHSVVQEWNKSVDKQSKIYETRDTFLSILNDILIKKSVSINARNELEILTDTGKKLSIKHLSSGEKQLLILLGKALLQQNTPWIYIADEPELSMHVKWQENLIHYLLRINPNAQVVFATHSPDIVSIYGNNVFDMEKVVL